MKFEQHLRFIYQNLKQSIFTYKYNQEKYKTTFLDKNPQRLEVELHPIPKIIYCFWTGQNEMSVNRKNCLNSIYENSGVEVILITPENLSSFILDKFPLHPSFDYLSLVHKSDYLRCYFMHHFGGGYADIKICNNSWEKAFDNLQNTDKWLLGYSESRAKDLARVEVQIQKDLNKHFLSVIGNCAYICRPYTSFTKEWYDELHFRLDLKFLSLKKYPGNILGDNTGYPLGWTYILGSIFHPLNLKYLDKILISNTIKPNFQNYR